MILLESGNRVLGEAVAALLKPPENVDPEAQGAAQREPVDVRLCDFDDTMFHVFSDANDRDTLRVSLYLPAYQYIEDKGGREALDKHFGSMLTDTETGYHATIAINLNNPGMKEEELVAKVANFKSLVLGGVFESYFGGLLAGKPRTDSVQFYIRSDTQVFMIPKSDRVTVVWGFHIADKDEAVVARVFMQQFQDVRKTLSAAPPCIFYEKTPPPELKEFGITEPTGNFGYLTFAVMKSHVDQGRKDRVVNTMASFRNFFSYHVKCSKAYFHSRMRARVVQLLMILNRAKQEVPPEKKEMKTIQGKTFTRS